ncbi:MAG: DUF805 domain-containing protein [Anaeromyxobacteraceae bacterium]
MDWYLGVLKKYVEFNGRARRTEYWMFLLINLAVSVGLMLVDGVLGTLFLGTLYSLGVLLPSLAVTVRRLHDTSRSGWWILIGFVPVIGLIVLIIFMAQDSKPGTNEYGPNPKEGAPSSQASAFSA